jgi:hypothetical protein
MGNLSTEMGGNLSDLIRCEDRQEPASHRARGGLARRRTTLRRVALFVIGLLGSPDLAAAAAW